MAQEKIDNIFDLPKIKKETDAILAGNKSVIESMKAIQKTQVKSIAAIGQSKSITDLVKSLKSIENSTREYKKELIALEKIEKRAGSAKEKLAKLPIKENDNLIKLKKEKQAISKVVADEIKVNNNLLSAYTKLISKLDIATNRYKKLANAGKSNARETKKLVTQITKLYSKLKKIDSIFDLPKVKSESAKVIEGNKKVLQSMKDIKKAQIKALTVISQNKSITELISLLKDVEKNLKKYKKELTDLEKIEKKSTQTKAQIAAATTKENRELVKLTQAKRETNRVISNEVKSNNHLVGAYTRLSAKLNLARGKYKDLAAAGKENTNAAKRYRKEIEKLDKRIKTIDSNVGQFQRNVGNYTKAWGNLRNIIGAAGVTLGAAGIFSVLRSGVKTLKDFEQANANLAGVLGRTRDEITPLTDDAARLGAVTVKTATDITSLQEAYARLGYTQSEILDLTEATINGSIALRGELSNTAELVGAVTNSFDDLSTTDAGEVLDQLTFSTQKSALNFEKLETALPIVAGAANAAGVPFTKLLSLLGKLSDAGIDTSSSATSLRNIFIESAADGLNYEQILTKIKNSQDKLTTANDEFGKRAAVSSTVLANNIDAINELDIALQNAGGTAEKVAKEQSDTLSGSMLLLESAWDGMIINAERGTGALSATKDAVKFIADNIQLLTKIVLFAITAFVGYKTILLTSKGVTIAYTAVTKALGFAKIALSRGLIVATRSFKIFNIVSKANVLGVLAGVVSAVAAAFLIFRDNVNEASDGQERFNKVTKKANFRDLIDELLYSDNLLKKLSLEGFKKNLNDFKNLLKGVDTTDLEEYREHLESEISELNRFYANLPKEETVIGGVGEDIYNEQLGRLQKFLAAIKKEQAKITEKPKLKTLTPEDPKKALLKAVEIAKLRLKLTKEGSIEEYEAKIKLLEATRDLELVSAAETGKDVNDIKALYDKEAADESFEFLMNSMDKESAAKLANIEKVENEKINKLREKLKDGVIKQEEFEDEKTKILYDAETERLQFVIDSLEKRIKIADDLGVNVVDMESELNKMKQDLYDEDFENYKGSEDQKTKKTKEERDKRDAIIAASFKLSRELTGAIGEIMLNSIDSEIQAIDARGVRDEELRGQQLESVRGNASAEQAINDVFDAKADVREKEIRQQEIKAAKFKKRLALTQIAINTAEAVTKAVLMALPTFGLPWSAFAIASGAIQAAAVSSQPIPTFWQGRDGGDATFGIVGEKGKEIIKLESGDMFETPNTATKTYLPEGSSVIPHMETMKLLDSLQVNPMQNNYTDTTNSATNFGNFTNELRTDINKLNRTIKGKKSVIDNSKMWVGINSRDRYTNHISQNVRL